MLGLRFKRDRYSNVPFIQVDKVVHHYTIEGADDAPALVFANSLGSDHRIWDPVLPHLREEFRIIRYDQRGHGLSDVTPSPYSIDDLVNDLAGLLEGLKVDESVVCGLSVGGMIAQGLAAASIDRPTLVLCGDRDLATPPELGAKLADAIPDAIFSLVEDAAHISCVEQPEIFSRLLINFLEEISSAS